MIEKYTVLKLKVIERNGQKLFYCAKEDFATNLLDANTFGYVNLQIEISFDNQMIAKYCLGEVGTHGAMMLFTRWWDKFATNKKQWLKKLRANDFAVGDVLEFVTPFKDEQLQTTFTRSVKYCYLLNGYQTKHLLRGRELSRREFCDCLYTDDAHELEWKYFVLGQEVSNKELSKAKALFRKGKKTGIDIFDNAREIIFKEKAL